MKDCLHSISQEEINDLRNRFPIDGKKNSKRFRDVIIHKLLNECERLLKENEQMVQVQTKQE